jgi:poly(A) polymerase
MLQSASAVRSQSQTAPASWCKLPGNALSGETLTAGWERSYRSGCLDRSKRLAAGSEILHLVPHKGMLFAAVGYWMDPRNPWYGGTYKTASWAQILRLDGPNAHWQVDLEMPLHLRGEILYSATFTTDANGAKLQTPLDLLLASTYEGGGAPGISLFTRDDTTGAWEKSKIMAGPTGKRGEENSVRAMLVHRDKVTGIDRLFVSVGVHGVFSGVYDPTFPGKIRWDSASETGPVPIRPLAIIEANGDLIYSADRSVFRRIDGPAPRYQKINDLSDLREGASAAYSPVGGIRGMTAITNPAGTGQSIVFVWAPGNRSRGCIMRLDRVAPDGYERRQEICLDKLVSQYLDGSPVPYVLAAYNRFLAVTDPSTGATHHLIGAEAWIPGKRFPTTQQNDKGGFYAGAMYAIRDDAAHYRLGEVNGSVDVSAPPLVATRAYALSPFAEDRGQIIYFGGYDCNFKRCSDTAWIFRTTLANALRERPARR